MKQSHKSSRVLRLKCFLMICFNARRNPLMTIDVQNFYSYYMPFWLACDKSQHFLENHFIKCHTFLVACNLFNFQRCVWLGMRHSADKLAWWVKQEAVSALKSSQSQMRLEINRLGWVGNGRKRLICWSQHWHALEVGGTVCHWRGGGGGCIWH